LVFGREKNPDATQREARVMIFFFSFSLLTSPYAGTVPDTVSHTTESRVAMRPQSFCF
jgi:hypothetical protein